MRYPIPIRTRAVSLPIRGADGITCDPAPDQPGRWTRRRAFQRVRASAGAASPADFAVNGEAVSYFGAPGVVIPPLRFGCAHLCEAAGGVDAFLIGSEMRGATTLRSRHEHLCLCTALVDLATTCAAYCAPGTEITYGADWTETVAHISCRTGPTIRGFPSRSALGVGRYRRGRRRRLFAACRLARRRSPSRSSGRLAVDLRSRLPRSNDRDGDDDQPQSWRRAKTAWGEIRVRTNNTSRIRARSSQTSTTLKIALIGWRDEP